MTDPLTIPMIFQENHARERQVNSWNAVTKEVQESQFNRIWYHCSLAKDGLTSREISLITGIERTSVTRVLSNYKDRFDISAEKFDTGTRKRVTAYRVKQ